MFKKGDTIRELNTDKRYFIQDDIGSYWYAVSEKSKLSVFGKVTEIKLIAHNDTNYKKVASFEEELEDL